MAEGARLKAQVKFRAHLILKFQNSKLDFESQPWSSNVSQGSSSANNFLSGSSASESTFP
jgi:hypothetical protein